MPLLQAYSYTALTHARMVQVKGNGTVGCGPLPNV
jgi:hypothetical protein